jgi:REP element-mobilizing transposase RayT
VLGEITDGVMEVSPAGAMVQTVREELPCAYPGVEIDAFVVMPNHVHDIVYLLPDESERIRISGEDDGNGGQGQALGPAPTRIGAAGEAVLGGDGVGATPCGCPCPQKPAPYGSDLANDDAPRLSLPDVVHRFKSLTTARYRAGVRNLGWEPFPGRFWQRNYYETVIRNQDDLDRYRRYIDENPIRWPSDRHNPAKK